MSMPFDQACPVNVHDYFGMKTSGLLSTFYSYIHKATISLAYRQLYRNHKSSCLWQNHQFLYYVEWLYLCIHDGKNVIILLYICDV